MTDKKWFETEILCFDRILHSAGVPCDEWFPITIDLGEVESYKVYRTENDEEYTAVFMRSGNDFVINMSYHDFMVRMVQA